VIAVVPKPTDLSATADPDALDLAARVRSAMAASGFVVFDEPESINVVGLRSPSRVAGRFDDFLLVFWTDDAGEPRAAVWPITTEPGLHHLRHPLRTAGAAILLPGQYRGALVVGRHGTRGGTRPGYDALVWRGATPGRYWRDGNLDGTLDRTGAVESGYIGTNIHASDRDPFDRDDRDRAGGVDGEDLIGVWSAGCQVFASSADYRAFWAIVVRSAKRYGSSFTYTLLDWNQPVVAPQVVEPEPAREVTTVTDSTHTPAPGPTGNHLRVKIGGTLGTLIAAVEASGMVISDRTYAAAFALFALLMLVDAMRPLMKPKQRAAYDDAVDDVEAAVAKLTKLGLLPKTDDTNGEG